MLMPCVTAPTASATAHLIMPTQQHAAITRMHPPTRPQHSVCHSAKLKLTCVTALRAACLSGVGCWSTPECHMEWECVDCCAVGECGGPFSPATLARASCWKMPTRPDTTMYIA